MSNVVAINASDTPRGRGHALAQTAARLAGSTTVIDLTELPADGLLGRRDDGLVAAVLDTVVGADVLVLVTPVYRSTYSALLKLLVERLPKGGLEGVVVVLAATGGSDLHSFVLEAAVRPLLDHVGACVVATSVYTTPDDVDRDGVPLPATEHRLRQALSEAADALADGVRPASQQVVAGETSPSGVPTDATTASVAT